MGPILISEKLEDARKIEGSVLPGLVIGAITAGREKFAYIVGHILD